MKIKLTKRKLEPEVVINPIDLKKDRKLLNATELSEKPKSSKPNNSSTAADIDQLISDLLNKLKFREVALLFSGIAFVFSSMFFLFNSADFLFIAKESNQVIENKPVKYDVAIEYKELLGIITEPVTIKSVLDNVAEKTLEKIVVKGFQGISLGDESFDKIKLVNSREGADLFLTNNEKEIGYSDVTNVAVNTVNNKVYKMHRELTFDGYKQCSNSKTELAKQLKNKYPDAYESKDIYDSANIGQRNIKIISECHKRHNRKIYVIAKDLSLTPPKVSEDDLIIKESLVDNKSTNKQQTVTGFQGISLGDETFEKIKLIKSRKGANLFLAKMDIDENKSDQTHIAVNTEIDKVYKIHREITYNNRYDCTVALANLTSALEKKYPKIYQSSLLFNLVQSGSRKIEIISKCSQPRKGRKIFVIAQDSSLTPPKKS